jgi:hypothetical protein
MKTALIIFLMAISSCEAKKPQVEPVPPTACDPEMRDWILQCIKNANPYSDEEPEDNTKQCERTAIHLFCGPECFLGSNGSIWCLPNGV